MLEISIKAKRRTISTKSVVNKLRKAGNVPGIYYSKGTEPVPIYVPELSLRPLVYTSETHIVNLTIDDSEPIKTILKDYQLDPVTDRIIHCDFMGISLDQKIELEVPVVIQGTAIGIKEGGLLQHQMHRLKIECLPNNIPEHIVVDISNLKIGESIHVKDLKLENIRILHHEDVIIASVIHQRAAVEVEQPVESEETQKEPEVIAKGKVEKEE
ncbi:50S ribosomal protein L25 [Rosettibacter firmus]|uniref:50S ribosomal protein L25 n=1 Tax=Rosettibacter firmus TaxID=3111522 RepID=UPI00336BCAB5